MMLSLDGCPRMRRKVVFPPRFFLDDKEVALLFLGAVFPCQSPCISHKCPMLTDSLFAYHFASPWFLSVTRLLSVNPSFSKSWHQLYGFSLNDSEFESLPRRIVASSSNVYPNKSIFYWAGHSTLRWKHCSLFFEFWWRQKAFPIWERPLGHFWVWGGCPSSLSCPSPTFRLAFSRDVVTTGSYPCFFLVQYPFPFPPSPKCVPYT